MKGEQIKMEQKITIKKIVPLIASFGFLFYAKGGGGVMFSDLKGIGNVIGYPSLIFGSALIAFSCLFESEENKKLSLVDKISFLSGTALICLGYLIYLYLWTSKYWFGG